MKPIVVVGSINMDLVSRTERIPHAGETILGADFQLHSGGKGANQAAAVARIGHPSILLGATGNDIFGEQLRRTLAGYGVQTEHIASVPGASGTASIVVDARGENTIIVTPGANLAVTQEYLQGKIDVLRGAGMVLVQLEIPIETVAWLVECCDKMGVPVMLDPAPACKLPEALLAKLTWFTPNETEAGFYADGAENADEALSRLFAFGMEHVILKQSSKGALIASHSGERCYADAFKVDAVDSTAAGDAFNGAFAVALMRGMSVHESARFAAAAAAISVTRAGAQPSLATEEETQAFLSVHTDMHSLRQNPSF
ncbi:MAG: ribokinase [Acidobacteria bacterium]|nr:ribokinase [Acidobacteriota bacterium]